MPAPDPNSVSSILNSSGGGNIWALLITAVTAATGKYAWDFYKKKALLNSKEREGIRKDVKDEKLLDRQDRNALRDDLKERVVVLEKKLDKAIADKEELMEQVGELKAQVAALTVKIEMLVAAGAGAGLQPAKAVSRPAVPTGLSSGAKPAKGGKPAKTSKEPDPPPPAQKGRRKKDG
jgi:hypothetical protein